VGRNTALPHRRVCTDPSRSKFNPDGGRNYFSLCHRWHPPRLGSRLHIGQGKRRPPRRRCRDNPAISPCRPNRRVALRYLARSAGLRRKSFRRYRLVKTRLSVQQPRRLRKRHTHNSHQIVFNQLCSCSGSSSVCPDAGRARSSAVLSPLTALRCSPPTIAAPSSLQSRIAIPPGPVPSP
jgi:hypothetical protein